MKTIMITDNTWEKLSLLKLQHKYPSMNILIENLLLKGETDGKGQE